MLFRSGEGGAVTNERSCGPTHRFEHCFAMREGLLVLTLGWPCYFCCGVERGRANMSLPCLTVLEMAN